MYDIEDLAQGNTLMSIAYDNKTHRKNIDTFLNSNIHVRSWRQLEKKMKEFQRIHKIAFRKVDLVASYKRQNLNYPSFYKLIVKRNEKSIWCTCCNCIYTCIS